MSDHQFSNLRAYRGTAAFLHHIHIRLYVLTDSVICRNVQMTHPLRGVQSAGTNIWCGQSHLQPNGAKPKEDSGFHKEQGLLCPVCISEKGVDFGYIQVPGCCTGDQTGLVPPHRGIYKNCQGSLPFFEILEMFSVCGEYHAGIKVQDSNRHVS